MGLVFTPTRLSDLFVDVSLTSVARGDVLYRSASKWQNLAPGTSGKFFRTNGAGADPSWETVTAGDTLPIVDTTGVVKGSADATKILRFEVDGFTTATTRVLTPPNADATIAGLQVAQTFTATQTITTGAAGSVGLKIDGAASQTAYLLHIQYDNAGRAKGILIDDDAANIFFKVDAGDTFFRDTIQDQAGGNGFYVNGTGRCILGSAGGFEFRDSGNAGEVTVKRNGTIEMAIRPTFADTTDYGRMVMGFKDAGTADIQYSLALRRNSTGTPAAGFGTSIHFSLHSTTTKDRDAAVVETSWQTATDASRAADLIFSAYYITTKREGIRVRAGASNVQIGVFGTSPASRQAAYTVTNPVDRRSFDTTTVTLSQLAEAVGTMIADDKLYGWKA